MTSRRSLPSFLPIAFVLSACFQAGSGVLARSAEFKRGEANGDSLLDIRDVVFTLGFFFDGGSRGPCDDAMDANDNGALDISDPLHTLLHLFLGGGEPPLPGLECGPDPTEDALGCLQCIPCGHLGGQGRNELAFLEPAGTCDEVMDQLRRNLIEDMEKVLDENLKTVLDIAQGLGCPPGWHVWGSFGGPNCSTCSMSPPPPRGASDPSDEAAQAYSTTNTQVEGVDEADFVKNDGGFIYILAGGKFQILDAWPPQEARRIAAAPVLGTPKKLFVHEDRAVVYSSLGDLPQPGTAPPGVWDDSGDCTYGYDCEFKGDGMSLLVTVFDISDRTALKVLREIVFTGSFLSGRRIGDMVHTVVVFPEVILPDLLYWPKELKDCWRYCSNQVPFPYTEDQVRVMFEELRRRDLEVLDAASLADYLPSITEVRYDGDVRTVHEGLLRECTDFHLPRSGSGQSLISLVSFDIGNTEDFKATTVIGKPGAVYASLDSLYIATRQYRREMGPWYFEDPEQISEATTIHKFRLHHDRPGSDYVGSGVVKGRILNQFSMDEHLGYLRIATTAGRVPSPDVYSTVSVLAEREGGLELVGQVDGIAPTEDIRSVRFDGDLGFLVTFKKTDPLFVLDLADPSAPAVRGELKIPGFSTYLHVLDEGHILSIGYDVDDQGSFAWFQGIQLQIMDIASLESPRLLHKVVIGTRGSTSDAATNHLAFNYFRPKGLLALPMVICEGGEGSQFATAMTFNGLQVWSVGLEKGFELVGGVPHDPTGAGDSQATCSNWWTRSNSLVKRSIFMDGFVYAVALDRIEVSALGDLAHPVAGVSLSK